jgi:hypothetical protein
MRTRLSLIAAVALSTLALAGCEQQALPGVPQAAGSNAPAASGSASAPKQADPATTADPKALISSAAKSTRDASTCKFEYKMAADAQNDLGMTFSSTGESDFKANRAKIDTVVEVAGKKMTMSIVTDNGALYMRSTTDGAADGPWTKTDAKDLEAQLGSLGGGKAGPGTDPMSFIDQIKDFASVTPDGSEAIRGVPTTRFKVAIDPAQVPGGEVAGEDATSHLWVDGQNRLARFEVGTKTFGKMTADFFDYGAPVAIEVPKVG